MSEAVLQRKLARAEAKVRLLESLIEDKTRELYLQTVALKASNETLERIFDAMPGPVLVLDEHLVVQRFNRSALKLLEATPLLLTGLPATRFFPTIEASVARVDVEGGAVMTEAEWRLEGPALPVLATLARFSDGVERHVVVIATDLRDRKALELELRHAQKLEAIGALAAGVAHEVNTPLQFISDNVDFLVEALTSFDAFARRIEEAAPGIWSRVSEEPAFEELPFFRERIPKSLGRVKSGLERVTEIVRALKDFSHPGGEKAPVRLAPLVHRAVTVGRHELKGMDVQVEVPEGLEAYGYESDLNQVMLNLLVNAAHAIVDRHGDATLGRIRVFVDGGPEQVVLHVQDNGGGMPPAVQARVFEPFFTTKPVGKGTGQGLPICRKLIVERHGGRLWFDSAPGEGTTFHIGLPVAAAPSSGATHEPTRRAAGG
ncbi:MAG: PAS domain-containing sensor histidine kinase [Myxococcaceae bacterium]|nr:PAS domain-containing sensor histidine kinase [Myxococcaceae bacterium]